MIASYLEDAMEDAANSDVALLLADGYPLKRTLDVVARLPVQFILVVTARVSDFRLSSMEDAHARVHVLPQPVWSRTLVEAIRRGLPVSVGDA